MSICQGGDSSVARGKDCLAGDRLPRKTLPRTDLKFPSQGKQKAKYSKRKSFGKSLFCCRSFLITRSTTGEWRWASPVSNAPPSSLKYSGGLERCPSLPGQPYFFFVVNQRFPFLPNQPYLFYWSQPNHTFFYWSQPNWTFMSLRQIFVTQAMWDDHEERGGAPLQELPWRQLSAQIARQLCL